MMKALRTARRQRRALPAMEWAEEAVGRCARVTVVGSRSVLVENYAAIERFTEDCVRLDAARGKLCILGDDLSLCEVRPGALIVRGDIRRLELPCSGGDAPDDR